jgi:lipopolysaccharide heptosyltransferase I
MSDPIVLPEDPQRILIIKPSAIGDIVHALPFLNLIRKRWPAAKISWVVTPTCASILEGHPQIDELILFHRKRFGNRWWNPRVLLEIRRFHRSLRKRRFDLVIDLQCLFRSGYMAWRSRAPIRVGLSSGREGATIFYTHKIPDDLRKEHAVDRYLKVAAALGCDTTDIQCVFPTNDADRASVDALLPKGKPYAVLLPGSNWATKRWPVEYFAETAKTLRQKFGFEPVVAGGPGDKQFAAQIDGIDLTGKTNLRQLVALLERASVVIANDSGPMHIAAALGVPLVTPFGPTKPELTGPYGRAPSVVRVDIPCSPCFSRRCSHQSCLRWLKPEKVEATVQLEIAPGPPGRR